MFTNMIEDATCHVRQQDCHKDGICENVLSKPPFPPQCFLGPLGHCVHAVYRSGLPNIILTSN